MGDLTPRLDLYLPGGGSTGLITPDESVDIDKLNDNFQIIDDVMGLKVVTSVTRPGSPFDGQPIYETDTKRIKVYSSTLVDWVDQSVYDGAGRGTAANFVVTDLAALDGLLTAQVGDTAFMTAPGTGINPLSWEAIAGAGASLDWQPARTVVADTKANLDTFIAAVAPLTADLKFEIGGFAFVTATKRRYTFTSVLGALNILEGVMAPTAAVVGGTGTATINGDGSVSVVAATTSFSLEGVFDSTLYSRYLIEIDVDSTSGPATLTGFLGDSVAHTDDATNYHDYLVYPTAPTTAGSGQSGPVTTGWRLSPLATLPKGKIKLELTDPGAAKYTLGFISVENVSALAVLATGGYFLGVISHAVLTAYTRFTVKISTGSFTGRVTVKGIV